MEPFESLVKTIDPSHKNLFKYVDFLEVKNVCACYFMPLNTTINADAYCATHRRLRKAIQNRRRGQLSRGTVLIPDNARPHTARQTQTLLHDEFHWVTFDHPPYSLHLASSDFYLFLKMKEHLAGKRFTDDEDLQHAVVDWLNSQAAVWYEEGISKLVSRYDKCLNIQGDYVEK